MTGAKASQGSIQLSDEQRLNWLQLIRSDNVGPATFRDLINHFRTAAAALEAVPELVSRGGATGKIRIASREQCEREIDQAAKIGGQFIGMGEANYPPALRSVDYPPPLICVRGACEVLMRKAIGIVGSRNASVTGMRLSARFASELGRADFAIVSGLARGIDASAHKHSLSSGTIAVFAGGVDKIFPDENADLAREILDNGGAFVSEMPMGWSPRAKDFPRRNRLVAGIAQGLLVIEAARRSGSLISARLANEAGRTVYAIPGSPLDPRSEGANWLIKQGATLITDPQEIIDDLAGVGNSHITQWQEPDQDDYDRPVEVGDIRQKIIRSLGPSPVEIDDIIRFSGATPGQIQLVLIELDLAGKLERHGGNRVSLIG
jgi:DNA processing protein